MIIFLGQAGAGKGTQSSILEEQIKFFTIAPGLQLRKITNNNAEFHAFTSQETEVHAFTPQEIEKIKNDLSIGKIVDNSIVDRIIYFYLNKECKNVILDGYPRTYAQTEKLINFIKENNIFCQIFYLDCPTHVLIERLMNRKFCIKCGLNYTKNNNICNKCNIPLQIRSDDNPEAIKNRLLDTQEKKDILEKLKSIANFHVINGANTPDIVNKSILEALELDFLLEMKTNLSPFYLVITTKTCPQCPILINTLIKKNIKFYEINYNMHIGLFLNNNYSISIRYAPTLIKVQNNTLTKIDNDSI